VSTAKRVRTDRLRGSELVIGTAASGPYEEGPRRLASQPTPAPEHSVQREAFWVAWSGGGRQVYYGDTVLLVAR
jgi:hypothetical protein